MHVAVRALFISSVFERWGRKCFMIMFFVHTCIFSSFAPLNSFAWNFTWTLCCYLLITHLYIFFKFLTISNSTLVAVWISESEVTPALLCFMSKSHPCTGLDRPWGFQEVEAPRFQDNQHMKVERLSVLRTDCLYPPGNIPGTYFC